MSALLVLTTAPNADVAESLSRQLVEKGLAACVKALAPCRATYRWQGQIESAEEVPLVIVTDETRYASLEQWLNDAHPYDVPEILAVTCTAGLPAYLAWVSESTTIAP